MSSSSKTKTRPHAIPAFYFECITSCSFYHHAPLPIFIIMLFSLSTSNIYHHANATANFFRHSSSSSSSVSIHAFLSTLSTSKMRHHAIATNSLDLEMTRQLSIWFSLRRVNIHYMVRSLFNVQSFHSSWVNTYDFIIKLVVM